MSALAPAETFWPSVFSYPVAALVFGLAVLFLFRKEISYLLKRVKSAKGFQFEAQEGTQADAAPPVGARTDIEAVRGVEPNTFFYGLDPDREPMLSKRNALRASVAALPDVASREQYYLNAAALSSVYADFEWIHHWILPRQLGLLHRTNAGNVPDADIAVLYEQSIANNEAPASYSIDLWKGWLTNIGLCVAANGLLQISDKGRAFLTWMVGRGYPIIRYA